MLILFNPITSCFFQQCSHTRCIDLQYGFSLTKFGRCYFEIEDNEVCVGQASIETKNRKLRWFLLKYVSIAVVQYIQGYFPSTMCTYQVIWTMMWYFFNIKCPLLHWYIYRRMKSIWDKLLQKPKIENTEPQRDFKNTIFVGLQNFYLTKNTFGLC